MIDVKCFKKYFLLSAAWQQLLIDEEDGVGKSGK